MKPRIALLALPLLFGFIFTLSLLLGLKQPTAAQAAALDAASAAAEGTAAEAADPPQPELMKSLAQRPVGLPIMPG